MMRLLQQVEEHARRRPEAMAYREITAEGSGQKLTYSELYARATSFGAAVRTRFGAGATVAVRIANTCEYPVAFLGILAAGCAVLPVPADIARPELEATMQRAGAAALVEGGLDVTVPAGLSGAAGEKRHGLLLQSSGTTGRPKIVYRPAEAIDAVCAGMVEAVGFRDEDRVLATVPLCHSYGLEHSLLAPLWAGASVHLCQGFDLHLVLGQLTGQGITLFPAVPSMYEMLARLADGTTRFPSLRTAYSAGGPLPQSVAEEFFRKYGLRISQLYGASEVGSITFTPAEDPAFDPRSVGRPMRGVEIRIAPPADAGASLAPGEEGQVLVRATSMFRGYVGDDAGLTAEGFFPTGDLGRVDRHGNLTITGRLKLLIDVGGLKVNPLEVEDVLHQHPGVAACVVVPMRMSETISRLKAVVLARDIARPPAAEELRAFARARLTRHKIPRVFEFRQSLPMSPAGKVLRQQVEA